MEEEDLGKGRDPFHVKSGPAPSQTLSHPRKAAAEKKSITVERVWKMYLHVGNNRNIRVREIIGIFDADTATVAATTKQFLAAKKAEKAVEFAAVELPKAFVLYRAETNEKTRGRGAKRIKDAKKTQKPVYRVCFSQLSGASLAGRVENGITAP